MVALWGTVRRCAGLSPAVGFVIAQSLSEANGARAASFTIGGLITMLTTSMIPFAATKGGYPAGVCAAVGFAASLAAS
jgi:hypothetical protein